MLQRNERREEQIYSKWFNTQEGVIYWRILTCINVVEVKKIGNYKFYIYIYIYNYNFVCCFVWV